MTPTIVPSKVERYYGVPGFDVYFSKEEDALEFERLVKEQMEAAVDVIRAEMRSGNIKADIRSMCRAHAVNFNEDYFK